ncbi:DUF4411 family protein [Stenotrophomonas sp.]|uniref:DUF4411 family protein n=1 Tax=Stenotrophomonas sp. TaxID=69392 RepID=UPI0028AB8A6A|nr:DUF4411 family protein [Stenotrophomonas sp.]
MIYLVDANVVMQAANTYFRHSWVPEFWSWLKHHGSLGNIKMPLEIFQEIKDGSSDASKDELFAWAREKQNKDAILLVDSVEGALVRIVLERGYSLTLNEVQLQMIGQDPFLVAHALKDPSNRCVVTHEVSRPSTAPHNRKLPDACRSVGVSFCTPFQMMQNLGFKTAWNEPPTPKHLPAPPAIVVQVPPLKIPGSL